MAVFFHGGLRRRAVDCGTDFRPAPLIILADITSRETA
jgi:hypothetical protein